MDKFNDLLRDIPLPRMAKVRQIFDDTHITDVCGAVHASLAASGVLTSLEKGMRIAVTAGSRGIADIGPITKAVVDRIKQAGCDPFVVPAMGSHGGATAEGQLEVLHSFGLTSAYLGCAVKSSMRVKRIGSTGDGRPVQIDHHAAEADAVVVVNRIKPHTSFTGPYESGLMKMLAIGLAKQAGAAVCHQEGYGRIAANVERYGRAILACSNVVFGVAIIENAYDRTCEIVSMRGSEIPDREPELLLRAKALMPRILLEDIDVLVVDRMGKNISGLGMDPHISGSFASPYASGPPRPDKVVVLDLSDETHGNANGVGTADVTTRRLFDKFDPEKTYPNALTATLSPAVRLPMFLDSQKLAIQAGIKMAAGFDKERIRLVRLADTLHLSEILVSESMLAEARSHPGLEVLGEAEAMLFDVNGDLF